jgi:LPS export ABC transporter protein LptC
VALAAVLALPGCESESTTPSAIKKVGELPADVIIYGMHHEMTKSGLRSAVLDSDTALLVEAGQRYDLQGVHLRFFAENGAESGTLTSRTGEYRISNGSFVARGNVVLITQGTNGPRRLETEELHYDVGRDQIWSDKPFTTTEKGQVTHGTSFRSDTKSQNWTIQGARTEGMKSGGAGITF